MYKTLIFESLISAFLPFFLSLVIVCLLSIDFRVSLLSSLTIFFSGHWMDLECLNSNEFWCHTKLDLFVHFFQFMKNYLHHELLSVPEKRVMGPKHVFWDTQYCSYKAKRVKSSFKSDADPSPKKISPDFDELMSKIIPNR